MDSTKTPKLATTEMEPSKISNGDSKSASAFQSLDAKIDMLQSKLLPPIPHLLQVPTRDPYMGARPWETNRNTPFEGWEWEHLQYMTLVPGDCRGVARPKGGWEEEINARSPYNMSRSRSGTATPRSERDPNKPRSKISLADYKNGIRAAKKPVESQATVDADKDKGSGKTAKTEPPKIAQNGNVEPKRYAINILLLYCLRMLTDLCSSVPPKPAESIKAADAPKPSMPAPSEKPSALQTSKALDNALPSKPRETQTPQAVKIQNPRPEGAQLPPKPSEPKSQLKRSFEKSDQSQPEKRMKIESKPSPQPLNSSHQRHPSDPMSKIVGTDVRSKPSTPKPALSASKGVNDISPEKPADAKKDLKPLPEPMSQAKEKSPAPKIPEMPRLLSPLPEYLTSPNPVGFGSNQNVTSDKSAKLGHASHAKSPVKKAAHATSPQKEKERPEKNSPFRLPELLPKELPPNVEEMLSKARQSAPAKKLGTVQARRERSRNPDTPGVARKAPKLSAAEKRRLSRESDSPTGKAEEPAHILLVKLKYKKQYAKSIERILKTKPVPNREVAELTNGIVAAKPSASKPKVNESKRPRLRDDQPEPSAKRTKLPAKLDSEKQVASSTPLTAAFKSPAIPPSSYQKFSDVPKNTLKNTPKKGEVVKSGATRKMDSNEGNASTPPSETISTPASAERPRTNGHDSSAEIDNLKRTHALYTQLGTTLKRKRDQFLLDDDHQMASIAGTESLIAYLVSFDAFDRLCRLRHRPNTGGNWPTLFPLLFRIHEHAKNFPVLDIVIFLLGGVASDALLAVHSKRLSEDTSSGSAESLLFRQEMTTNINRRRDLWDRYYAKCQELFQQHPEQMADGTALSFVRCAGGQGRPISTIKVEASKILKEFIANQGLTWDMKLDF